MTPQPLISDREIKEWIDDRAAPIGTNVFVLKLLLRLRSAEDALKTERAKSKRYKAALEMAVEALENLPLYSSRKDKGVWVNCRVKGSAMWGLQNAEPKFIESFERMEGLRRGAIETARLALSDDPKEEQEKE